jgi:hypothetical protein
MYLARDRCRVLHNVEANRTLQFLQDASQEHVEESVQEGNECDECDEGVTRVERV